MAPRVTEEDKALSRAFVNHVQQWSGKSWETLVYQAGLSHSTVEGWRKGKATPEAPLLYRFLRAAGLLDEQFRIRVAPPPADQQRAEAELEAAQRRLEEERPAAPPRHAQDG